MAVKTGYKKNELARAERELITAARALVSALPAAPIGAPQLVCCCDRCIDPPALAAIMKTPPKDWPRDLVSQYYGGAGAVGVDDSAEGRDEAWIVLTHTVSLLAQGIALPSDEQRDFTRANHFIEPEYWTMNLLRTGVIASRDPLEIAQMRAVLTDCVALAAAKGGRLLRDALSFLALTGDGLRPALASVKDLPARKQLRFWTSFAGWIDHSPHPRYSVRGIDLHQHYFAMPVEGREALCAALEDPATERLIERYAFAAQDADWARYLSRLLQWREATLLSTQWSERAKETLMDRR